MTGERTGPDWFVQKLHDSVKTKQAEGVGMTEIAFRCGVSVQMLYNYLRGDGEPKIGAYISMARYFGWPHPLLDDAEMLKQFEERQAQTEDRKVFGVDELTPEVIIDSDRGHSRWSAQTPVDLHKQGAMSGGL